MSAEDPYRWAKALLAEGSSRDQAVSRMVAGGVDQSLAAEIVDSIERNRPRPEPLRIGFGVVLIAAGIGVAVSLFNALIAGVLIMGGLFSVWDGFRKKR